MWHSLAVPALTLLLGLQADPELEARCREGATRACVAAARDLQDRAEPKRLEREDTDPKVRAAEAHRRRTLSERDRGESGGQLLLSGQYGSEGFTAAVGVIAGRVERGYSHTVPVPETLRGVLIETEVGARSFKASVGMGGAAAWLPVLSTGTAAKLSYLNRRGGGPAGSDSSYLGVELDIWMLAKLTLGVFKSLGSDAGYRVSWGIGFGI